MFQKKCNIPKFLIAFFKMAVFALNVFRLELFFQIVQPVSTGLSRDYSHSTAADDLLYKTLLKKQPFNAILKEFQH